MGPPPPAVMEELVEEVLLRLSPAEPASLVRAALVCKPWCRLIAGRRFRRRFREFHRTPPVLGVLYNFCFRVRLVPTASTCPAHAENLGGWFAVAARHGRVLLYRPTLYSCEFVVWDLITQERRGLPRMPLLQHGGNATVLCAAAGGSCDHRDCSRGPFLVVLVSSHLQQLSLLVCSSEAGAWREPTYVTLPFQYRSKSISGSALAGNTVYIANGSTQSILGYDLATCVVTVIRHPPNSCYVSTLLTTEDGRLGVASIEEGPRVSLWSMESSPDGDMRWDQIRVMELDKQLLIDNLPTHSNSLGFAHGAGILFLVIGSDLFSIDLNKTGQVRKLCQDDEGIHSVVPFMSFYSPALGAFAEEEPGLCASSA